MTNEEKPTKPEYIMIIAFPVMFESYTNGKTKVIYPERQ